MLLNALSSTTLGRLLSIILVELMSIQTQRIRRSSSNTLPIVIQRVVAVVTGVFGLFVLYGGIKLFIAGLAHYQASAFIEQWEQQRTAPSEQAWTIVNDAITRAIDTHPASNGKYLEKLGYIQQWHSYGAALNDTSASSSRQAAVQALRKATLARPTWPDAWAALAYAKLSVLELDDEFTFALRQAQHFGPWRIGINRRIAEIGLIALPALNSEQAAIIFEAAQRTAQYSAKEQAQLFSFAKETETLLSLCRALKKQYPACTALILLETPTHG